jgi:hypothetical protein
VTGTGELGDGSVGTTQAPDPPADGDDIVVIPGGAPDEPGGRQLVLIIAAALVSIGVIVAAIAVLTRHDGKTGQVAVRPPSPTAPVRTQAHPQPKAKAKPRHSSPASTVERSAVVTLPKQTPVTAASPAVSSPPQTVAPPTVPTAPPKQYGASALTWSAPHTMTVAAGKTASLTVVAFNHTDGVVNMPHPLSCAPRLDHTEVCVEMVQSLQPGASASAKYTIDARGIAPGHYTLQIEGVLTVLVTVS